MKVPDQNKHTDHDELTLLLPWYVNDTLETDEKRRVECHLTVCLTCRREILQLSRLQHQFRQLPTQEIPTRINLDRFWSRLDQPRPSRLQRLIHSLNQWRSTCQAGPAWAMALALIVGLPLLTAAWLPFDWQTGSLSHPDVSSYRTQASPTRFQPGDVRVIFSASVERDQLARLLETLPIQILILEGQPMMHNHSLYVLRITPATALTEVLPKLRQLPRVILAEPVIPGPDTQTPAGDHS